METKQRSPRKVFSSFVLLGGGLSECPSLFRVPAIRARDVLALGCATGRSLDGKRAQLSEEEVKPKNEKLSSNEGRRVAHSCKDWRERIESK